MFNCLVVNYFLLLTQFVLTLLALGTFIPPCEGICSIAINPGEFEPLTGQVCLCLEKKF